MSKPVFEVGQIVRNKYLTQGTIINANSDGTYDVVWATGDTAWFVEQEDIYVNSVQSSEELSITADLVGRTLKMKYGGESGIISDPDTDEQEEEDVVNHPSHYTSGLPAGVEVIDIIRAQGAGYEHGNVIKYILRWQYKNGIEDLKKAKVYLDWLIKKVEDNNE